MKKLYDKPCCYFYLDEDGRIAYVGKANGTLNNRISAHAREQKFKDCGCEFDIRYQEFDTSSDMDVAEKVYIKSLKPYLNVVDATTGPFPAVSLDISSLKKWDPKTEKELAKEERRKKAEGKRAKEEEAREFQMHKADIWGGLLCLKQCFEKRVGHTFGKDSLKKLPVLAGVLCLFASHKLLELSSGHRIDLDENDCLIKEEVVWVSNVRPYETYWSPIVFLDHVIDRIIGMPKSELESAENDRNWVRHEFGEFIEYKNVNKNIVLPGLNWIDVPFRPRHTSEKFYEYVLKANPLLGRLACVFSSNGFLRLNAFTETIQSLTVNGVELTNLTLNGIEMVNLNRKKAPWSPRDFIRYIKDRIEHMSDLEVHYAINDEIWVEQELYKFRKECNDD